MLCYAMLCVAGIEIRRQLLESTSIGLGFESRARRISCAAKVEKAEEKTDHAESAQLE